MSNNTNHKLCKFSTMYKIVILMASIFLVLVTLQIFKTQDKQISNNTHIMQQSNLLCQNQNNNMNADINSSNNSSTEIISLDVNYPIVMESNVDNFIYYYNSYEGYYLFKILSSTLPINMDIEIYEDGILYTPDKSEIKEVQLPSIETSTGNINAFKIKMYSDKEYKIQININNVDGLVDNKLDTLVSISSWKSFDTIKINDEPIFQSGKPINGRHIYFDETYTLSFTYIDDLSPESNSIDIWKPSLGMDSLITNTSTSFTVLNNNLNEDKIVTIEFLDYENIYTINFIIKQPYYANYVFDNKSYDINLIFYNSYGNQVTATEAKFQFMEISLGNQHINIDDSTYNVITMPIFNEKEKMSIIVHYDNYIEEFAGIEVHNSKLDISSFSGSGTEQRLILYGEAKNKTISLNNSIKAIFFEAGTICENVKIDIDLNHEIYLYLNDTTFKSSNSYIINSNAKKSTIYLVGKNVLEGKSPDYLLKANGLAFVGEGSINIVGENGINGSNGTENSINGGKGTNGTNCIYCREYVANNQNINIIGGNGGNGGHGYSFTSDGKNGGAGGDGGNAGIGLTIKEEHYFEGFAGLGGNGGNGGQGSDGIRATGLKNGTAGSNGGNGGNSGKNGEGNLTPNAILPKGGNGGNGGKGGDGTCYLTQTGTTPMGQMLLSYIFGNPNIGGNGGNGGNGYIGGTGGNGGNGGNGYPGANSIWGGPVGSNGGAGAQGGKGGNGGNSYYNESSVGNGGTGGKGGVGGSAGKGIMVKYYNGVNGAKGANGQKGLFVNL